MDPRFLIGAVGIAIGLALPIFGAAVASVNENFTTGSEELWQRTVDYSGTWAHGGKGVEYEVSFVTDGPECRANWSADELTTAGGPSVLSIDLSPSASGDESTKGQYLHLEKQ